jgi:two-component system OmpR family sensor kinase
MRRIEEESARMGSLVDELLLLARLDQGRPLERAPVDLARIAADAVDDARTIQPGRPIEFNADGATVVEGDEARLRQVVINLLSNTLEHTPNDARVNVTVSTNEARARITVADEGPGLSAEDAERIFDRFFRVDPSRARENGGAGLGLSIVKAIVEAHHGTVSLETAAGRGARFIVELPGTPPPEHPLGENVNV